MYGAEDIDRLKSIRANLQARAVITETVRAFFRQSEFLEIDTPIRIPCPANEDHIDAEPSGRLFLRTSPELHMKRLLAAGYERLFQLGPCFRAGEQGRRHLPEFTMLEWYRARADYLDILADCGALVGTCRDALRVKEAGGCILPPLSAEGRNTLNQADPELTPSNQAEDCLSPDWELLTVEEAFRRYAAADVDEVISANRFEEVLVDRVEPHLGVQRPTVLIDYPISMAALAKPKPGRPDRAERWELYMHGIEIANAFSELTDPDEQARRFAESVQLRQNEGRECYPIDENFMAALRRGLPPCAGIALGVDRLLMVLLGTDSLDQVVAFPPQSA